MRKLVYGALALSAAMAVSFGVSTDASAAEPSSVLSDVTWDISSSGDDLTIKAYHHDGTDNFKTAADKILVGVPTFKADKLSTASDAPKVAFASVASWDVYSAANEALDSYNNQGSITVDIAKYAVTKDNYLMVKADYQNDSEAVLVRIPKSTSLTRVDYEYVGTAASGAACVVVRSGKAKTSTVVDNLNLEFYTDSSTGATSLTRKEAGKYTATDLLDKYSYTGAAVYVRTKGTSSSTATRWTPNTEDANNALVVSRKNYDAVYLGKKGAAKMLPAENMLTLEARRGPAKKVTITKRAAAPKATIDYAAGTITLAKGKYNYTVVDSTGEEIASGSSTAKKTGGDKVKLTLGTGEGQISPEGEFYVTATLQDTTKPSNVGYYAFATSQPSTDKTDIALTWNPVSKNDYKLLVKNESATDSYTVTLNGKAAVLAPGGDATITPKTKVKSTKVNEAKIYIKKNGNNVEYSWVGPTIKVVNPGDIATGTAISVSGGAFSTDADGE